MTLSPTAWKVETEAPITQRHWGSLEVNLQAFCGYTWLAPGFCSVICTPHQSSSSPELWNSELAEHWDCTRRGLPGWACIPAGNWSENQELGNRPGDQSEHAWRCQIGRLQPVLLRGHREFSSLAMLTLGNCTADFSRPVFWRQSS